MCRIIVSKKEKKSPSLGTKRLHPFFVGGGKKNEGQNLVSTTKTKGVNISKPYVLSSKEAFLYPYFEENKKNGIPMPSFEVKKLVFYLYCIISIPSSSESS